MKKNEFESYRCVCLCTTHLTADDAEVLTELANINEDKMIFDRQTGFIVKLYGEPDYNNREGMSASYTKIVDWALAKGYRQIEFDHDVEPVDYFETFQW